MIERIIYDWKRTLYDPETGDLLPGARGVISDLSDRGIQQVLIGKGGADMDVALDALDARRYFSAVHFVPSKSDELFTRYISTQHPETTLVVGDRAQGEIAIGKGLGARAIWLRAGAFKDELPLSPELEPDEIIVKIDQLLESALIIND